MVGRCSASVRVGIFALLLGARPLLIAATSPACDLDVGTAPFALPSRAVFASLQAAIDAAATRSSATTICIAAGSYTCAEMSGAGSSESSVSAALAPLTIRAAPGGRVSLDCEGAGRALAIDGDGLDVTLMGIDVVNGRASSGGALAASGARLSLTVLDCTFRHCIATCAVEGRTYTKNRTIDRLGYYLGADSLDNGVGVEYRTSGCGAPSDARGWVPQQLHAPAVPVVGGGGAISVRGGVAATPSTTLAIARTSFSDVAAAGYGGAVLGIDVTDIDIERCDFENATAPFIGGGVAVLAGAGADEGAGTVPGGALRVVNSTFTDVAGGGAGGGGVGGLLQGERVAGARWSVRGSSFVRCSGGAGNALAGGGGGVGLVATARGEISRIALDVHSSHFEECTGGNANIVAGGGGGVGVAAYAFEGPVTNVTAVLRAASSVEGCAGGNDNLIASGAGGVGVAAVNGGANGANVSSTALVVSGARVSGCEGAMRSLYVAGAGGVGVGVISMWGGVDLTQLDVSSADVADCVGGVHNSLGAAGGIGAAVQSPKGDVLRTRFSVRDSAVARCVGGKDNWGGHATEPRPVQIPMYGGAGGIALIVRLRDPPLSLPPCARACAVSTCCARA